MKKELDFDYSTIGPESWTATNQLRYINKWVYNGDCTRSVKELQQAWQGSRGSIEWRDIETVEAPE